MLERRKRYRAVHILFLLLTLSLFKNLNSQVQHGDLGRTERRLLPNGDQAVRGAVVTVNKNGRLSQFRPPVNSSATLGD